MAELSAEQIYHNFHDQAKGTGLLTEAQQGAQTLAGRFPDRAVAIGRLVDGVRAGWQGMAADEASQGLSPLAQDFLAGGDDLHNAQNLASQQVQVFGDTVHATRPVPPEPTLRDGLLDFATKGPAFGTGSFLGEMKARNAAAQANVDAMNQYTVASSANTTGYPPLQSSLQPSAGAVSVDVPRAQGPGAGASAKAPAVSSHGPGHGTGSGSASTSAGHSSQAPVRPPTVSGSQTVAAGSGISTGGASTAGTPTGGWSGGSAAGPSGSGIAGVLGAQPGVESGGGGRSSGGAGGRPVAGGIGDEGNTAGGRRGMPPGARSGAGNAAAGVGEETAGTRAAAGRAGQAGAPGMGGRGAGGKGEEDKEHKAKVGPLFDGEEVFGSGTPMVAPEVIGELQRDAEERRRRARGE